MKQVTVDGQTFDYQQFYDEHEYGTAAWVEFYQGMTTETYKKYLFFGKVIIKEVPILIFTIHGETTDITRSKDWWTNAIRRELAKISRVEEVKRGELV